MTRTLTAAIAVAAATTGAAIAADNSIVQTFDYNLALDSDTVFSLDGFDDFDGGRRLDSVTFAWDVNYRFDYTLESTGPTPVAANDFVINTEYQTLHQIGTAQDTPWFYGFGGYFETLTADLPGFTTPGENVFQGGFEVLDNRIERTFTAGDGTGVVEYYTRTGQVPNVVGGFGLSQFVWINQPQGWEPFNGGPFDQPVYPDDDAIWFTILPSSSQWGSLTATYEFTVIPAPATGSVLAVIGIAAARRRR